MAPVIAADACSACDRAIETGNVRQPSGSRMLRFGSSIVATASRAGVDVGLGATDGLDVTPAEMDWAAARELVVATSEASGDPPAEDPQPAINTATATIPIRPRTPRISSP